MCETDDFSLSLAIYPFVQQTLNDYLPSAKQGFRPQRCKGIVSGAVILGAAWEESVIKGSHFKVLPRTVFKDSRETKVLEKVF